MKFAVFTDLHYDAIPDGDRRLDEFLKSCKAENVDFIIDLGDMCNPSEENRKLIERLNMNGVPCYHSFGNHNTDEYEDKTVLDFFDIKKSYYSFMKGKIRFLVLDANYIKKDCGVEPYCKRNYSKSNDEYPYIPEDEITWLKNEIMNEEYYYIVISHQSLANDFMKRGVANRHEVRKVLEKRNRTQKRVLLCMNGHDHGDDIKLINGIYYYTLNSMSYIWHGMKEIFSYSEILHRQYPHLKDMILYEEPLHIIVTIDENMRINIAGMNGKYQKHSPEDIGLGNVWNGVFIEPRTSTLYI